MIKKIIFIAFVMFSSTIMIAQTTITGTVKDAKTGETLLGASIKVTGKAVGTTTDFDGNFTLKVNETLPFTIEVSMLGFQTVKVERLAYNSRNNVLKLKLL